MAHAPSRLKQQRAATLVRVQGLRASRTQAAVAQCAADCKAAYGSIAAAQDAAAQHAADASQALRQGYDGLIGQQADLFQVLDLRNLEAQAAERQRILVQEATEAQERLRVLESLAAALHAEGIACARQLARRERILDAASRAALLAWNRIEELQAEDRCLTGSAS